MTAQTFTVTYRGNGADSGMTADATAYATGETATVKANSYTCDGCTFTGWNTEPDGSGAPYKAGDQITMTDNVVLYAQWTRNSSVMAVTPATRSGSPSSMPERYAAERREI